MKNYLGKININKILIAIGIVLAMLLLSIVGLNLIGKKDVNTDASENSQLSSGSEFLSEEIYTENEVVTEENQNSETQIMDSQETEQNVSSEVNDHKDITNNQKPSEQMKPSNSENASSDHKENSSESESVPVVTESHTVHVASAGGHNLYNVKVHAYTDKSMTKLFATGATNSKGVATLQLEAGKEYVIALSNVPTGYHLKDSYSIVGKETSIRLDSSVIKGTSLPSKKLKVGNVMYDFTVPGADGQEIMLSEVLKTKDLVVLNFWYVNCQFCVMEFPYMSSAYNKYKDIVEIIALNPFDNMSAVNDFLTKNPLPFKVATCDGAIPNLFGIDAYPVSVIIDKHGVIREIEEGAILEENGFVKLFKKYL